jgi:phage anti-repressor protein
MKELMEHNDNGQFVVSANRLYSQLGLTASQWTRWSRTNIKEKATQGVDYQILRHHVEKSKGRPPMDYLLSFAFTGNLALKADTPMGRKNFICFWNLRLNTSYNGLGIILKKVPCKMLITRFYT